MALFVLAAAPVLAASTLLAAPAVIAASAARADQPQQPGAPSRAAQAQREKPSTTPPEFFSKLALADALAESKARKRLLVVVVSPDPARAAANLAIWRCDLLANWAAAHAVVVHVTDRDTIRTIVGTGLKAGGPDQPLVFREGLSINLFGSRPQGNTSRLRAAPKPPTPHTVLPTDAPGPALRLYLKLDWTLRGTQRSDPEWWAAHSAQNPRPERPRLAPLSDESDTSAMSIAQAEEGAPEGQSDALSRLIHVRQIAQAIDETPGDAPINTEDARRATALATWLWERGMAGAPECSAAIMFDLPPAMLSLASRWAGAADRFRALRNRRAALIPWMNDREFFAWLLLCRVVGDHVDALDFLDAALDDTDARALWPLEEYLVLERMLPRAAWSDPLGLPSTTRDPVGYVRRLVEKVMHPPSKGLTESGRRRLAAFSATQLVDESCRVYAALLSKGREEEAERAARVLIEEGAGGIGVGLDEAGERAQDARVRSLWLRLISSAVARGQGREHQLDVLGEAKEGEDETTRRLRQRVRQLVEQGTK